MYWPAFLITGKSKNQLSAVEYPLKNIKRFILVLYIKYHLWQTTINLDIKTDRNKPGLGFLKDLKSENERISHNHLGGLFSLPNVSFSNI